MKGAREQTGADTENTVSRCRRRSGRRLRLKMLKKKETEMSVKSNKVK